MGGSCGPTGSTIAPAVKQVFLGISAFLALVETIALAVHFQDMDMVGEAVQQSPGQAFEPNISVHSSNGKLEVTRIEPRS